MEGASVLELLELEQLKALALIDGDAERVLFLCQAQAKLGPPEGCDDEELLRAFVVLYRTNERRIRDWLEVLTQAVGGLGKGKFFSQTA